jgi:glycosyltransferase involved in cell wall biosynthesis
MKDYSVIVPVYNSDITLKELFARIKNVFEKINKTFEVVFIDDGSHDSSWNIIKEIKKENSDIIIACKLTKNFGQHNAILCGISLSNSKAIITIDDDLQIPPEEIPVLIDSFENNNYELIYGCFTKKKHSLWRNLGSLFIKKYSKQFKNGQGQGSSFKIFTSEISKQLLNHSQEFVYIDELLLWYTDNIGFVNVKHEKRKSKKSGYTTSKIFQLTFNLMIYYTALPLKMMIWGGFISAIISFFIGIYFIIKKVYFHVPHGYTSIIVTILFSTSVIILSLGIIGEYLHRIYKIQNKKPPFSIKEIL